MTAIAAALLCCCDDDGGEEDPWPGSPCPGCPPYVDMAWDGSIEVEARCCDTIETQCLPPKRCRPCEASFQFGGDVCRDCPGFGCFVQRVSRRSFQVQNLRLYARPGANGTRCQWIGQGAPQFFDIYWCCTQALPSIGQCAHGDTIPLFGQGSVEFKAELACLTYPTEGYIGTLYARFANRRCLAITPWKPLFNFVPLVGNRDCDACPTFDPLIPWKPVPIELPFMKTTREVCNWFPRLSIQQPTFSGCGVPDFPIPWAAFDLGTGVKLTPPMQ